MVLGVDIYGIKKTTPGQPDKLKTTNEDSAQCFVNPVECHLPVSSNTPTILRIKHNRPRTQ
jgi:hypothetical protein